jgi:hypothetical protein
MSDSETDLNKIVCDKMSDMVDFGMCVVNRDTHTILFKNSIIDKIYQTCITHIDHMISESDLALLDLSPTGSITQVNDGVHYTISYEIDKKYIFLTIKKNFKDQHIIEQLMNIKKDIKDIVKEL